jgi:tetratricopeptide (TPR) repeat protein
MNTSRTQRSEKSGAYVWRHLLGMAALRATGRGVSKSWSALLAEAYGKVGQTEAGLRVVAEVLAIIKGTALGKGAELYRLQGELLLARSAENYTEAETCFQQALEVARRQEAKALKLRAAMSLSRLWQQQGKRDEARELLAPVYGWFTEGFDTPDLQEAEAQLDELS